MLGRALEVVFPPRCAGCGGGAWPFCPACRRSLEALRPPWCRRCGAPGADAPGCADCPPPAIDHARAPFRYAGPAKAAVHRLKFAGWRGVAAALAEGIGALELPPVDAVTWVPLGRRRLGERGFDQARALAIPLGRRLGRPVVRLIGRGSAGGAQARRGAAERRAAVRGAFAPIRPAPARVLLVDDVLTTGATAADCARALREGGAAVVILATAARSLNRPVAARGPGGARGRARAYTRPGSRPGLWLPGDPPR